ncbi:MAG: transketolase [Candidatus Hodarchaeales archaeon]
MKAEIAEKLMEKSSKIRKRVVSMISFTNSGHVGGCFSAADLLTSLYFYKMRIDINNPEWEDRDRFILSKGHSAPVLYSILIEIGHINEKEQETLRSLNSRLQGHPTMQITPGIDMTTGSLGMGLSAGCGIAIAAKLDNKSYKTYVLLGDGELQEGQIWEAVMTASHFRLNNLIAIVDKNNLQSDSPVKSVSNTGELASQFKSFNWNVIEIDGHNLREIMDALDLSDSSTSKPTIIIADTCKGKGVSFMEHNPNFHAIPPSKEETNYALTEIESNGKVGKL